MNNLPRVAQINREAIVKKNILISTLSYLLFLVFCLFVVVIFYKLDVLNSNYSLWISFLISLYFIYKIINLYMSKKDNLIEKIKDIFYKVTDSILPSYVTNCNNKNRNN